MRRPATEVFVCQYSCTARGSTYLAVKLTGMVQHNAKHCSRRSSHDLDLQQGLKIRDALEGIHMIEIELELIAIWSHPERPPYWSCVLTAVSDIAVKVFWRFKLSSQREA